MEKGINLNGEMLAIIKFCDDKGMILLRVDVPERYFLAQHKDGTPTRCAFDEVPNLKENQLKIAEGELAERDFYYDIYAIVDNDEEGKYAGITEEDVRNVIPKLDENEWLCEQINCCIVSELNDCLKRKKEND